MSTESKTVDLDRVTVASPCPESWDGMDGDDRVRFCDRCALNVYNLSGMTRAQATDLVSGAEGRLCVRYFRRTDGTMLTADCPVGVARRTGRLLRAVAASLLAMLGFLPGCGSDSTSSSSAGPDRPAATSGGEDGVPVPLQGEVIQEESGEVEFLGDFEHEPQIVGRMVPPPVLDERR